MMTAWVIAATVAALATVVIWATRMGRDAEKGKEAEANVEAAERVADAQAGAPVDITDLLNRLRDGKRGGL